MEEKIQQPQQQPNQRQYASKPQKSKLLIIIIIVIIILAGATTYYFLVYSNENSNESLQTASTVNNSENSANVISNTVNLETNSINNASNSNFNNNVNAVNSSNANTIISTTVNFNTNNTNSQILEGFFSDADTYNDEDSDGLANLYEARYGTNYLAKDTDADGFNDNEEIISCYDPTSAGKMNSQYYSETYCPNYAYQWLLNYEESGYTTKDQMDSIYEEYVGLCEIWADFSDEVFTMIASGTENDEIYSNENSVFASSCGKTSDIYETGALDELIDAFSFNATTAEEFCKEFPWDIQTICGESLPF